jgi:hypothetical protein
MDVISRLHKLIVHLKDECQEISSYELTVSMASLFEGKQQILTRNAYFVRESTLYKVSQRNGNQRLYRFFLFSDELIYGSTGLLGGQYKKHGQLPLHAMTVTDIENDPTHCSIYIDHPFKSFSVVCPSPLEKNQWLRDIFQAISNCNLRAAMAAESRADAGVGVGVGVGRREGAPSSGAGSIEQRAAFLRTVTLSPNPNPYPNPATPIGKSSSSTSSDSVEGGEAAGAGGVTPLSRLVATATTTASPLPSSTAAAAAQNGGISGNRGRSMSADSSSSSLTRDSLQPSLDEGFADDDYDDLDDLSLDDDDDGDGDINQNGGVSPSPRVASSSKSSRSAAAAVASASLVSGLSHYPKRTSVMLSPQLKEHIQEGGGDWYDLSDSDSDSEDEDL